MSTSLAAALPSAPPVVSAPDERLTLENAYLRQRNAQLQDDITSLTAEANRLHQLVQRLHGRMAAATPNPPGGGL